MNQASIYPIILTFSDLPKKETRTMMTLIFIFEMMNMTQKITQNQSSKRRIKSISLKTQPLFAQKGPR